MIYLKSVEPKRSLPASNAYPFSLAAVEHLDKLVFDTPVTFFVGENGTGKSTLLEAIAYASERITVGGQDIARDPTMAGVRDLGDHLSLSWAKRTARGFFMRSEDFFNFASRITETTQEMDDLAASYDGSDSFGALLARNSAKGQHAALAGAYGDLHARSHGEAFLQLFQARFAPGGLYLLDEPDTALSPLRQLALISMMSGMVEQRSQFIIASHSPMLMAFPEATIYRLDESGIRQIDWNENDNVILMRDFLNDPNLFLRQL
jgi:predicted ATPase